MTESCYRFAPSPTGNVHIGNIRVAIFNWLQARHCGGEFLLRIEDTDQQRSTPEAIDNLLQAMHWLGLDYDREPLYQSRRRQRHRQAAEQLLTSGQAYRHAAGQDGEAVVFRIPLDLDDFAAVTAVGPVRLELMPGQPLTINSAGIAYVLPSRKGKPVPQHCCLAGMKDLQVRDVAGNTLFALAEQLPAVVDEGRCFVSDAAAVLEFTRRQVSVQDLVKGPLAKPLDSLRDLVVVRSDGSPVFHLANVVDDVDQGVTDIVRGDDHVENTYRHLFLFRALGRTPPRYAHLPMIVNPQGKPYSKRDGAAFVGEFRRQGYLPEALFNYLTLLGWSPGGDREKMNRQELVSLFSLSRVQRTAAQMDLRKLDNLNGQYMAELPLSDFIARTREQAAQHQWSRQAEPQLFARVAALMQSRTKKMTDLENWQSFFVELPNYDEKETRKHLSRPGASEALAELAGCLDQIEWEEKALERAVCEVAEKHGVRPGKLNQPLRLATTGAAVGAGIFETIVLLGRERVARRLAFALDKFA